MPEAIEGQVVETLPPAKPTRKALKGKTDSLARTPHEDPFLAIIERAISTPNFEVSKLQELLAVRERWENREAQKAYTVAINKFKQNPPTIIKNREVGFDSKKGGEVNYSHATLDQVCDAIIKALSDVGVSHKWRTEQPDKTTVRVTCVLRHEFGGTDEATLEGPPDTSGTKNMIQAIGSTVTYLERYTLLAVCGLAVTGTDTDGTSRPSLSEIACPSCGKAGAIIKGKAEYGGGFVCWKGKDGCGATFENLPGSEAEDKPASSEKVPDFKQNKFAGKILVAQRVDAGDHQVLVLRIEALSKKKGKNNKWTTTKEEVIVVAEQSNFMRLLEGAVNTKIEVMCSQQPGAKDKVYWRIEKIISGGNEAGFAKDKADMKPGEENKGHGNEGTQKPAAASCPRATDICDCGHKAGDHVYGADACSEPDCPCQKFVPKRAQEPAGKPTAEKPKETTAAPAAAQPAPAVKGPAPKMAKVPRTLTLKGGKKQEVEWNQVRGKITGLAPKQKTKQGSWYMTMVIEGLPDGQVRENRNGVHDVFYIRHAHLFDAMATAKVNDTIVFCYEPETTKEGIVWQNVEDLEWIGAVEFMNGQPVMPGYGTVPK